MVVVVAVVEGGVFQAAEELCHPRQASLALGHCCNIHVSLAAHMRSQLMMGVPGSGI